MRFFVHKRPHVDYFLHKVRVTLPHLVASVLRNSHVPRLSLDFGIRYATIAGRGGGMVSVIPPHPVTRT